MFLKPIVTLMIPVLLFYNIADRELKMIFLIVTCTNQLAL